MIKKSSLALIVFLLALTSVSHAQTLRTLVHQPSNGAGIGLLLTDGTVMFQGNNSATWWKLTRTIPGATLTEPGRNWPVFPPDIHPSISLRPSWPTAGS